MRKKLHLMKGAIALIRGMTKPTYLSRSILHRYPVISILIRKLRKNAKTLESKEENTMLNISRSRPLGITIIAIIMAIFGILGIIGGITLLGASATTGVITLILGILELIVAWGLWSLQRWAYWATVILEILALVNGIFLFTQGNTSNGVIAIVIAAIILIYLFVDPNVRAAFRT